MTLRMAAPSAAMVNMVVALTKVISHEPMNRPNMANSMKIGPTKPATCDGMFMICGCSRKKIMPEMTQTSAPTYRKMPSEPRLAHFDLNAENGDSECTAIFGELVEMVLRTRKTASVKTARMPATIR